MDFANIMNDMENRIPAGESFVIDADGLRRCAVCGDPLECMVDMPEKKNQKVKCSCRCVRERRQREEAEARQTEIECRWRPACFEEHEQRSWTFAADDRRNPKISDAMRKYAADFPQYRQKTEQNGLLLYGTVGTGKSFYAACIANAVLTAGYTARMQSFSDIIRKVQGDFGKDYVSEQNPYDMLVLDDLGAERGTSIAQEIVFSVVDRRVQAGKPMVITCNLTAKELNAPENIEQARIYDRIFQACIPVEIGGTSRRKEALRQQAGENRAALGL